MSDLKCPFCQQELGTENYYVHCRNPHCNTTVEMSGTEELWQELINERQHATDCQDLFIAATAQKLEIETELERTRKALDVAINVLNRVKDVKYEEYIDEKLEQINEITHGGKDG